MNITQSSQDSAVLRKELNQIFAALQTRDLLIEEVEDRLIEILSIEPSFFIEFPIQTEKICLAAVQKDWRLLLHVRIQTKAICLAAVQTNGLALSHARKQSPEICTTAISSHPEAIQYAKRQTKELCLQAIEQDPWVISLIRYQNKEVCFAAYQKEPRILPLISKEKVKDYCLRKSQELANQNVTAQ